VFLVCVLVVVICQAAWDHRRPCNSFLTNSFFSCKDRALEHDRPYQRKKKNCIHLLVSKAIVTAQSVSSTCPSQLRSMGRFSYPVLLGV
jgi:hypothetical protein